MEPHPVPQDILNTEFRLFGSFTLKQFLKLVFGSLAALFFFILEIPWLIKFPLVSISLILGIALAIVPRFEVWLSGYLKAIFISPRYVWIKQTQAPDALESSSRKAAGIDQQKVSSTEVGSKINLEEISLEKLLATRDNPRKSIPSNSSQTPDPLDQSPQNQNFDRVFNQIYGDEKPKLTEAPSTVHSVPNQAETQPQQPTQTSSKPSTKQEYVEEINKLKSELNNIVKDQNHKDREAEIMNKINDLLQDLKMIEIDGEIDQVVPQAQNITDFQGKAVDVPTQNVFGVVVDKSDKPVSGAKVIFDDVGGNRDLVAVTDDSGKFATKDKVVFGDYNIIIEHPQHRFHAYKIAVGEQKLPMYKLRAK